MLADSIEDARRQIEICNACRYCEGLCSVFPAISRQRAFSDADITQLANLCHNCRSCYYACQYIPPHEFNINLPQVLAEVRRSNWNDYAWPKFLSRWFTGNALITTLSVLAFFAFFLLLALTLPSGSGEGFYALISHNVMVAIFLPAFLLPLLAVYIGQKQYWREVGGKRLRWVDLKAALGAVADMKNLAGGHGKGCNFEETDRFSNARRHSHQATFWGFLLCFAATSVATVMHYGLDRPAPYPLFSLPKLLGLGGGILLCMGTAGLAWLKLKADRNLGAVSEWRSEMAFVLLLFTVSASGLVLYWSSGTAWLAGPLAFHLASVLTLFLLMPYSKMVHGFYRLAALCRDAQIQNSGTSSAALKITSRPEV